MGNLSIVKSSTWKNKGPSAILSTGGHLVSKCFAHLLSDKAAELLAPLQLGTGIRGSCKAIVRTVRSIIEDPHIPLQDMWLLQADLKREFQTADCKVGFEEMRKHFPEASR